MNAATPTTLAGHLSAPSTPDPRALAAIAPIVTEPHANAAPPVAAPGTGRRFTNRRTKIIFTIGPATEEEPILEALIRAGADVIRINMAHADHAWTRMIMRRIRSVSARVGRDVATLMDIKGPEIRTGDLDAPLELRIGEIFDFTVKPGSDRRDAEEVRSVDVNYRDLVNDIRVGDTVLVDNGLITLEVLEKHDAHIRCRVLAGGELKSRRHINLPGVTVNLPSLTEKDRADAAVGIEEGVDFIALSFVRSADDIALLRTLLAEKKSKARIIAKVEDQSGITNLDEIVRASDALMIARGDLGIECPLEELPIIQRRAVRSCLANARPVIVATHMLESMITQPIPTRAEITDVANAVYELADCVMLSGETTVGRYPLECLQVLDKIARRIERETRGLPADIPIFISPALGHRAGQPDPRLENPHLYPPRLHGARPRRAAPRRCAHPHLYAAPATLPPTAATTRHRALPHALFPRARCHDRECHRAPQKSRTRRPGR